MLANTVKFHTLTLTALPLLLHQGKKVRKHTPRLPPPEGDRKGRVGGKASAVSTDEPFKLLVLGDSAAEGVGVSHQDEALLGQLVARLSQTCEVDYQLIANTGDTTKDIIRHVQKHIAHGNCLRAPDLVVISAGVNDVTTLTSLRVWRRQIRRLTGILQNKLGATYIVCTAVPPMQHFPALPSPLNAWLGLRAAMLNDALKAICQQHKQVGFLKLETPFDKKYIAADGFHPSKATYEIWARAVIDMPYGQ